MGKKKYTIRPAGDTTDVVAPQRQKDEIGPKYWLQHYEGKVLTDPRFTEASDDEQKMYLGRLFDEYGSFMLNGTQDPQEIMRIRNDYINGTFNKLKEPVVAEDPFEKKVEEEPLPTMEVKDTTTVEEADTTKTISGDVSKTPVKKPTGESDLIKEVKARAEKYYTDKGWPSPTWKISEYERTMEELQRKYLTGEIDQAGFQKAHEETVNNLGLIKTQDGVRVSPEEVKLYREQVEKYYRLIAKEKKEGEKDGFLRDVWESLGIGSAQVMGTGTRILATSEMIANGILSLAGQKERWGSTYWQDQAKVEQKILDEWRQSNMRYDAGITDMVASGDMAGAAGQTIMSVAENLPLLTLLVLGNASGYTNATLGYMGFDKATDEYLRQQNDPELNELTKVINAIGKGMSEVVFENMGTISILNSVRRGVREVGERQIRDQLIKNYTPFFQKHLSILMKGSSNMVIEGSEEMATELTDNLMDIAAGRDIELGANVIDAGIVGAVIGYGLSAPEIYAEYTGGKSEYVKQLASMIPDDLDFESKIELAELLIEGDKVKYDIDNGPEGATDALKTRLGEINERVAELMGVKLEEAEKAEEEKKGVTIKAEELKIAPEFAEKIKAERAYFDDMRIREVQEELGLPETPDLNITDETDETLDMIYRGEPVINERLKSAADNLYEEYKKLEAMKKATKREYTMDQINDMQEVLEEEITNLNNRINEQAETGEFKTEKVKLTDEIEVSQITEEREGEPGEGVEREAEPEKPVEKPKEEPAEEPERVGKYEASLETLDIEELIPTEFEEGEIEEGKEADVKKYEKMIEEGSEIPPILVQRNDDGTYTIIDGHRRYQAAKNKGIKTIKAIVRNKPSEGTRYILPEELTLLKPKEKPEEPETIYGKPEEILSKPVKDFAEALNERKIKVDEEISKIDERITNLKNRLKAYQGRLRTEQRKEKRQIENDIIRAEKEKADLEAEINRELSAYLDKAKPELDRVIDELAPDISEDMRSAIMDNLWAKMINPKPEEEEQSIEDLLITAIDEETTKRPGAVPEVQPKPEEEKPPEKPAEEEVSEEEIEVWGGRKVPMIEMEDVDVAYKETEESDYEHIQALNLENLTDEVGFRSIIEQIKDWGNVRVVKIPSHKKGKYTYWVQEKLPEEEITGVPPEEIEREPTSEGERMRETGKRVVNGVEYTRQNPIKKILPGNETVIRFGKKEAPKGKFVIMEAKDLQPSHLGGIENPRHFIPEAQPRNRGNLKALADAAREKAQNLDPEQLEYSPNAYTGAPVVNTRGEVIQGNGRAEAILYYYSTTSKDPKGYKSMISKRFEDFGFEKAEVFRKERVKFEEPVLVRMLDVNDEKAINLGNYGMKDLEDVSEETADIKQASNRLNREQGSIIANILLKGNEAEDTLNDLIRKNAGELISKLTEFDVFSQGEAEKFRKEGEITPEGVNAVEGVIKGLFFKGGNISLPEVFEELPHVVKKGIEKSMPILLRIPTKVNILPSVRNALMGLYEYSEYMRAAGEVGIFQDWVNQTKMFEEPVTERYTPFELKLIEQLSDVKRQSDIVKMFMQYEELVKGKEGDLFEGEKKGISREEATSQIFGEKYQKTVSDEYEVRTESEVEKPAEEPEKGERAEEEAVEPEVKTIDVKKDIEDLSGLLDDIDFDEGQAMAAGAEGDLDARTKMLNISKNLVGKMVKSDVYTFDRMIAEILPSIEVKKLEKLLPFLKQAYLSTAMAASPEVKAKMNTMDAGVFDEVSLDRLIGELNKPTDMEDYSDIEGKEFFIPKTNKTIEVLRVEEWDDPRDQKIEAMGGLFADLPSEFEKITVAVITDNTLWGGRRTGIEINAFRKSLESGDLQEVPTYDNPEYRAGLDKAIEIYKSIGDLDKVAQLEKKKWREPKNPFRPEGFTWEMDVEQTIKVAQATKEQEDILAGKIMYDPIFPETVTEEQVLDIVESMVHRGDPLTPFIKRYVTQEDLDRLVKIVNHHHEILAKLGFTNDEMADIYYLRNEFFPSASIAALYPVGAKARAFNKGRQGATEEKVYDAVEYFRRSMKEDEEAHVKVEERAFTWDIKHHIWNAKPLNNWLDVVRIAKKWGVTKKSAIRDQYERAMIDVAKTIMKDQNLSFEDKWSQIYGIYQSQPGISQAARTGEVKEKQQYSTPLPLAALMGLYTNSAQASYVLEPSAGMGALLIDSPTKRVRANEIDPRRYRNLLEQGYLTYDEDSSHGLKKVLPEGQNAQYPVLLMNPPFGGAKESYNGYPLSGEYVHVAYNLEHLSDNGKAAIIVGGHIEFKPNGQMKGKDLYFFNWLNKYFNVEDVIQIPGDFYKKMGASYPIKLILINGRKAVPEGVAPLRSDKFNPVQDWGELRDRVTSLTTRPNEQNILQPKVDAQRGDDTVVGREDPINNPDKEPGRTDDMVPEETPKPIGERAGVREEPTDRAKLEPDSGSGRRRSDRTDYGPSNIPKPEGRTDSEGRNDSRNAGLGFGEIRTERDPEDLPVNNIGKPNERTKRELGMAERTGDEVTSYYPLSQLGSGNFIVPASIANEVEAALMELRDEIGDVDQYVKEKLKYDSIDQIRATGMFAEQMDGIAQSVFNIESGNAMIIGHQTGTGKGRIGAGVIRYAIENGKFPVFITKSADLFTDMYRDLIDIGSPNYKPFIMNKQFASSGQKVRIFHPETGEVLHEVDAAQNDEIIGKEDQEGTYRLPDDVDMLMTTYSQFTTEGRDDNKRKFLMNLAKERDIVFIMDESHMASGMSNTGDFFMNWLQNVGGGVYMSATYAKRPDSMPLYAMKTVLQETNMSWNELVEAIKSGGPALQEILTLQLAEAGQFSKIGFKMDADVNYLIIGDDDPSQRTYNPEAGKEMLRKYDGVTFIIKEIINFQKDYVNPILEAMDDMMKKKGGVVAARRGTVKAGISNQPYFSRVWQILDQLVLAIKTEEAAKLVIEDLKKGLKPVVALKSTMESVFEHMRDNGELEKGEMIDLDFSTVMKRGMQTVMKYTVTDEQGNDVKLILDPEDLSDSGRARYYELMKKIQDTTTGIPLSPIDMLREMIVNAGFDVVEITGRNTMFKMTKDLKKGEWVTNDRGDKIKALKKFNNNPGVAAIINTAGSTGISMHSSVRFADKAQRSMYILQNDLDINVVVQILGRVYRADQVNKPIYNILTSTMPAEMRFFMMNAKKLKSLDANTSGNQQQSKNLIDVPDFLNKYGDEVVIEYLRENPDINQELGDPVDANSEEPKKQDAAHRVTYRVQILPSELQDEFNSDVIDRYERKIEYLNSTGRNDLMVTSEDLKATISGSDIVIQGYGGWSAFGDDTILNTVEADVTRKPYSKKELDAVLEEVPTNQVEEIRSQMERDMLEKLNENIAKIEEEYEENRRTWRKKIMEKEGLSEEDKEKEYDLKINELNTREENRILSLKSAYENNKEKFNELLDYFETGDVVYVPFTDEEQTNMFRQSLGMFIGFDVNMNKKNPWVPSNFVLKFATTDSRRMVRIPASRANHIGAIMNNSRRIDEGMARDVSENWDKKQSQRTRETRYIVTQNILQGMYDYRKGRLIQFTKADGTVDKGILMPENWIKPDDRIARIPINKSAEIIRNLPPGEFIESFGGDVIIYKQRWKQPDQRYELKVPATTKRGGKYYTNEALKELIIDGYWEQTGDRMVAEFADYNLQEVLDVLHDRFKVTLEVDSLNVQRSMDQTDAHNVMNSFGQVKAKTAKRRGGLSNPYVHTIGTEERSEDKNRIQPKPLTGETPKQLWEIQFDLSKAVGTRIRYARRPGERRRAGGAYYPGTGKLVIKWHGDLNTTAHEIGHNLDDIFGILGPEAHHIWPELKEELSQLWEYGSDPPKGHPNPEQYRMMEGMAEFIRAFVVNPHEAQRRFSVTYSWVKERISKDPDTWQGLLRFSRDVRIWWGSTAADQIISKVNLGPPQQQPRFVFRRENDQGQFQITWADRFARKYTNFFRPLEQAYRWALAERGVNIKDLSPLENWEFVSRLLLGQDVKLRNAFEKGLVDFQGNRVWDNEADVALSFHHMMSQIPNHSWKDMDDNLREAIKYGMAERVVEIPGKFTQRQMRMDLSARADVLPPENLLRKYPHIEEMFAEKINRIRKAMDKGELDPDDVYLPEERYDFTDMVIIGIAQEGMRDYDVAVKAVEEYNALKRTDPEKYKWISEFNRIYREIGRNIMMYARDSGLISEASFQQIDNENLYYMAMRRLFVMDPAEIVEGKAQEGLTPTGYSERDSRGLVKLVVHPIKGSQREVRNPIEALMEAYYQVVRNGDLNYSILQFAKAFNGSRDPYMDKLIKVGEVAWVSRTPEQRSIPFFVNGKKKYLVIPDKELFELVKNFIPDTSTASRLVKGLAWLPQKLRTSIIMAPVFAGRNIIRDLQHFLVMGKDVRYLRPKDLLRDEKMRNLFETTGGGQFGYLVTKKRAYYQLMKMAMFKISEDPKKWIYARKEAGATLYEKTFGVFSMSERVTRMLQFKASMRKGMKEGLTEQEAAIRAAYNARDLMDFMVGGTYVKELNRVIIFLNPAIRGLDRIARSIKDPQQRYSVMAKAGVLLALPGILNSLMIALWADADEKEEYLAAPDYQRDMFFRIPVGGGWVMIPRPFELAAITSIFQRATDKLILGDETAFSREFYKSIGHLLTPIDVAGIFGGYSGLIGAVFNVDLFRQKNIIPPDDVGTSVISRNTSYASKFGKLVQEASDLISWKTSNNPFLDARKVDAFIRGQFSYYGNFFLKATEALLPGESQAKYKFDPSATGFYRYADAYAEPDVQWLLRTFKKHEDLQRFLPDIYSQFNLLLKNYFADDVQQNHRRRREIGSELREFAAVRRDAWKDINFYDLDAAVKAIQDAERELAMKKK